MPQLRNEKSLKNILRKLIAPCLAAVIICLTVVSVDAARIKDLASIKGIRTNQLSGYGLVVGLSGTGDKSGTEFTIQSLVNMLEHMGVHVDKNNVKVKNVAAVVVTAKLPPFGRVGSKIDVVISSVGDAQSLEGGTLLMTPLRGVDGNVYALAQGGIALGGFSAGGEAGGGVTKNHLLAATIARGATIEREIPLSLNNRESLTMALFNPDFTTVQRVSETINQRMGKNVARALDSGTLNLDIPDSSRNNVAKFIADIETLEVEPDTVAKIVVNEKTGTVVIGENVRISTVAITHGNLIVSVKESQEVYQPEAFAAGQTVVAPETEVEVTEEGSRVLVIESGSTIGELVRALNAIGVSPRDLISIFQSIRASGALQAELEII
ncbi:MAG: flagellar basal body P-ring protein FlgI [Desulfobacterales bacterium]|nr:flagellar basal body P-ring protein FlgI [Desulfobacterales bacterium]